MKKKLDKKKQYSIDYSLVQKHTQQQSKNSTRNR